MNYDDFIIHEFETNTLVPPVGQGTIAIEAASNLNPELKSKIVNVLDSAETHICLKAERAFLKELNGGCSVPAFAYCNSHNEDSIFIEGGIIELDGSKLIRDQIVAPKIEADATGSYLAKKLLRLGGDEILNKIKKP